MCGNCNSVNIPIRRIGSEKEINKMIQDYRRSQPPTLTNMIIESRRLRYKSKPKPVVK
ncbi:MAG: hypothetical protein ACR2IS_04150 [Nitrososphaeraceae archaeon]